LSEAKDVFVPVFIIGISATIDSPDKALVLPAKSLLDESRAAPAERPATVKRRRDMYSNLVAI